jgi:uncharacterized membrane protein (DUF4010 family)
MPFLDMQVSPADAATALAVALGCGLLVGVERERRKGSGPLRGFAGLRTFAVTSVVGAAAALTQAPGLVVTGALLVAGLALLSYWRDRSDDPGVTTEMALLLTYLVGVLSASNLALAAGLSVGLTALLAGRERLHRAVLQWLRPGEVRDGIVLAALALMALPLLPDQPLWQGLVNPHQIVRLLVLLLGVQSLAHLAGRLLAARHAVAMSALASGFVSSTATIASLGLSVRERGASPRLMAGGGLLSCVSTQVQLLLVAAALQPAWLALLWAPALVGALVVAIWGWVLVRATSAAPEGYGASSPRIEGVGTPDGGDRMFSLRGAAAVAGLLTGIQLGVHAMQRWLGDAGLLVGVLVAALADLHAALAAVFSTGGPAPGSAAVWAVSLALLVHAASKSLMAAFTGGPSYLKWLAPGLWLHTLLVVAGTVWLNA